MISGTPGEIRTPDLLIRSQTLYPAELRALSRRDGERPSSPKSRTFQRKAKRRLLLLAILNDIVNRLGEIHANPFRYEWGSPQNLPAIPGPFGQTFAVSRGHRSIPCRMSGHSSAGRRAKNPLTTRCKVSNDYLPESYGTP